MTVCCVNVHYLNQSTLAGKRKGTLIPMTERRPFEEAFPHLREFAAFLDELNKESERGAALIAGAMLDDLLERSIRAFLLEHEEVVRLLKRFNAPLGTWSARALAAFALGVISDREYKEIERLRKIRNVFAHNVHASFLDQNVKDMCANLDYCAKNYGEVVVGLGAIHYCGRGCHFGFDESATLRRATEIDLS